MMRSFWLLGVVATLMLGACNIGSSEAPGEDVQAYTNFTLIDGTGGPAVENAGMLVEGGRIAWIGPAGELEIPDGVEPTDLTGKHVMPGMMDLHVHLGNVVDLNQDKANYSTESVERDLRTYASYGVTTVLSMGTDQDLIFGLRGAQREGRPETTRVYTAGQGLVFEGGYGGLAGVNNQVATVDEAVAEVNAQADKGVDIIKFWMDDELGTMPKMPYEMSQAIIDTAHERGLRVAAHIFYLADAKELVEQGVDALAHAVRDLPVDQELIEAMNAKGVWQVAETLSREASMFVYGEPAPFLGDPFFRRSVSEETLKQLASPERQQTVSSQPHFHDYPEFLQAAQANYKRLADGGVDFAFGTDSGPPGRFPGYFAHWELALMVDAGFTPAEALHAATGRAAEFLQVEDLGTLERSHWADFVVLDADPLADILNSRAINSVYIAGRQVQQ
jgi:imidazolonepropionase-like amidohydrolase